MPGQWPSRFTVTRLRRAGAGAGAGGGGGGGGADGAGLHPANRTAPEICTVSGRSFIEWRKQLHTSDSEPLRFGGGVVTSGFYRGTGQMGLMRRRSRGKPTRAPSAVNSIWIDTVKTMTGIRLTTLLALSASALTLAACGAAEVASPGEGDFGGTGGGGTTTPPTLPRARRRLTARPVSPTSAPWPAARSAPASCRNRSTVT